MSALIGALRVTLGLDTAAFEKGADLAQKRASVLGKKLQGMGDKITGLGAKLSVGITAPFTALMATAIPAAIESREAIGQVNAALKSMGPVAGFTASQLQKMAGELQSLSTFDDDDILKKVTTNLLTFGNISGQAFERAQLAAVNLSARLGQDLQSSAIQVGKALNDPIRGVTALQRVGVSFTQAQRDQIKAMTDAGNAAGAQSLILGELERQFGGAAKAAREASPGADLQEKWRNFQEVIGELALKVLPPLTNFLTKILDLFNSLSPATQSWVVGAVALAAALGPILLVVGPLLSVGGALLPLILKLGPAFMALATVLKALGPLITAIRVGMLALLANPIIIGAAVLITGIYLAWKHWDKIVPIVQKMVVGVAVWLKKLAAPFQWVHGKLTALGQAFFKLYDKVVGHSYVPDMVDEIGIQFARLEPEMVIPTLTAIEKVDAAFAGMGGEGPMSLGERLTAIAGMANEAMKNVAEDGIRSLADGLTAVIGGTAKLGDVFRQVAQQIIADLLRIQIQKFLMSAAASIGIPLPSVAGARAAGGPVIGGKAYLVGERGPELFMPGASGNIVPNHAMGGRTFNISVTAPNTGDPRRDRATAMQQAAMVRREVAKAASGGY